MTRDQKLGTLLVFLVLVAGALVLLPWMVQP